MKKKARAALIIAIFSSALLVALVVLDLRPNELLSVLIPFHSFTTQDRVAEELHLGSAEFEPRQLSPSSADWESFLASGFLVTDPETPDLQLHDIRRDVLAAAVHAGPSDVVAGRIDVGSGDFDYFAHYDTPPFQESGRFAFDPRLSGSGLQAWHGLYDHIYQGLMYPEFPAAGGLLVVGFRPAGNLNDTPGEQENGKQSNKPGVNSLPVPEPSSLLLLAGGLAGLALLRSLWKAR